MELTLHITSICPVCSKTRYYKTERSRDKNLSKPCKACANSIKRGGAGVFINSKGERLCKGCNEYRSKENYYRDFSTYCKLCSNNKTGTYIKTVHRYSKYGIEKADYDSFLGKQHNSCAICKEEFSEDRKPRIDHDHVTGEVRGLLCHNCNTGLGHFKDDINFLKATIKYLENGDK